MCTHVACGSDSDRERESDSTAVVDTSQRVVDVSNMAETLSQDLADARGLTNSIQRSLTEMQEELNRHIE